MAGRVSDRIMIPAPNTGYGNRHCAIRTGFLLIIEGAAAVKSVAL